ncbi:alkaline phosphatase D [Paraburkholderia sp. WSM4175]|uniref:alkaline phosphatase D family protein n=1 Tax=Paraburkholderia sp. WSM4175 TaxID=2991072 RepID=UPI003D1D96E1
MKRRHFLKSSAFFTIAAASGTLTACRSAQEPRDSPGSHVFPQGVASGDPRDRSVVLWTRCTATRPDADVVPLHVEVSTQRDFSALVASVPLRALRSFDFTVRAKITGLRPSTTFYYRFVAGRDSSPMGKTRTAPLPNDANTLVRFAWLTCQDWSVNHWEAMKLIAAETDLDFVVHVGDYIYETVGTPTLDAVEPAHSRITLPHGRPLAGGGQYAESLDDYRSLYRTYRSDPRLQALHRQFPMIAIWDDHEFTDDCWQDHQTYTNEQQRETQRRRNATQAWAEYMPVDWSDVRFDDVNPAYDNIRIYRAFQFGSLMQLVMTDERLYRDSQSVSASGIARARGHDPVHGDDAVGSRYFVERGLLERSEAQAANRLGRSPSILGSEQTRWWKATLKSSSATWKVWGNEVMLNRLWVDLPSKQDGSTSFVVNGDSWDGYPAHRHELLAWLSQQAIRNIVAITGDLHAFQCGVLRDGHDPSTGQPVAVDFVCAGISSTSFYAYVRQAWRGTPLAPLVASPAAFDAFLRSNNPGLRYVDHDAQGYASATVTPEHFAVVYNKVRRLTGDGKPQPDLVPQRVRLTVSRDRSDVMVESLSANA